MPSFSSSVLIVLISLTSQAFIWWTTGASVAARAVGLERVFVSKTAYTANRAARSLIRGGFHALCPSFTRYVYRITSPHSFWRTLGFSVQRHRRLPQVVFLREDTHLGVLVVM
jgi:hypothetical protein